MNLQTNLKIYSNNKLSTKMAEILEKYISDFNAKNILDMCCGNGIIGILGTQNCDINKIDFVDVDNNACNIAKKNIQNLKNNQNINIYNSDVFDNVPIFKYDIIISLFPCFNEQEYLLLKKVLINNTLEPKTAFIASKNNKFAFLEKFFSQCFNYLNKEKGIIILYCLNEEFLNWFKINTTTYNYSILNIIKDNQNSCYFVVIEENKNNDKYEN